MSSWADVAVLTGTKTLDGRFVVRTHPGLPFLLSEGATVYFVPPVVDVPRQGVVLSVEEAAGEDYLVRFDSVPDKTTASALVGAHCLMAKSELDQVNAVLAQESLEGFAVVDEQLGMLGVVEQLIEMPGQLLIELSRENGATALIPFVDEFICDIDVAARTVTVSVPPSLLEL